MRLRLPKTRGMLRREAANWLARLQSEREPDIESQFRRWHDSDPAHAAAFERVKRSYGTAAVLRHARDSSSPSQAEARSSGRLSFAFAASLVALIAVGAIVMRPGALQIGGTDAVMLQTNVGEIRQVGLSDGTRITLDTSTRVEVELGRTIRAARLRYGRARFDVARSSKPFVVEAGRSSVLTDRATMDVERNGRLGRVDVLAGTAEVHDGEESTERWALGAGQELTLNAGQPVRRTPLAPAPDWTRGMLEFEGTPLAQAVELANRYSDQQIIVESGVGALRVTGAFRAGDTEGLAKALAAAFQLSLTHSSRRDWVLAPKPESKRAQ